MEQSSDSHNEARDAVPEAERRPILLRAYADVPYEKRRTRAPTTPKFVLVFDTETAPDESQQLPSSTLSTRDFYPRLSKPEGLSSASICLSISHGLR
jgi:hypothetical protein